MFRRRHAKKKREVLKEQMREAAGMSKEEVEYMSRLVSKEEVEQRRRNMLRLREGVERKMGGIMKMYDEPISEERKAELKDIVTQKRRLVS